VTIGDAAGNVNRRFDRPKVRNRYRWQNDNLAHLYLERRIRFSRKRLYGKLRSSNMTPFSLRHQKALRENRIKVSLGWKVRDRLWATMESYNESYYSNDNWNEQTTLLYDTQKALMRLLGSRQLAILNDGKFIETDFETYFTRGFPVNALDVLEVFVDVLGNHVPGYDKRAWAFQREENDAMTDFECPWRLSDGLFFQIDSAFLDHEIVQKAEDQLRKHGFAGALDEFREARDDLSGGEHKDAIAKAGKSVESTLKIVTDRNGDLGKLIEAFQKLGFLDDLPDERQRAILKPIFCSLGVLRNELGSHGQGEQKIAVSRPYAALAVQFAGAITQFVIEQYLRKQPPPAQNADPDIDLDAEPGDIPF
jgi:hypothetical protein